MRKLLLVLTFIGFLNADDESAKLVLDLTTGSVENFDRNILQSIAYNKTHYANSLKELEVAVVIHGEAYRFFVKDLQSTSFKNDTKLLKVYKDLKKRVATMSDTYEVEFLMCRAALSRHKLKESDIVEFVKIVPNSTIALIDKQNEGFTYLPVSK
jgi:intracellular sulfur oxidation DsrE/DsrF family protein